MIKAYFKYKDRTYSRELNIPLLGSGTGQTGFEVREFAIKQQVKDHQYCLTNRIGGKAEQIYLIAQSKMNLWHS